MSATEFLDRLSKDGVLDDRVIDKLRKQVDASKKPVEAKAIAQLLVKNGLLEADEAKRLLVKEARPAPPKKAAESDIGLADDVALGTPEPPPAPEDDVVEPLEALDEVEEVEPVETESAPDADDEIWDADSAEVMEDDAEMDEFAAAAPSSTVGRKKSGLAGLLGRFGGSSSGPKKFRANRWDSPLMLVGGGALILLIFAGLGLYFFLTRGTGDDAFSAATEQYRAQAYSQAAGMYRSFIDDFADHPQVSLARVRIGMAEIWELVERQRWEEALEAVKTRLPQIEGEEDFNDARPELASLLPEIMDGFADSALEAESIPDAEAYLANANEALEQVNNSSYLPTSVRAGQQNRIEDIQKKLQSVEHRINQDRELQAVVAEIARLSSEGLFAEAYAARDQLIDTYAELETDPRLIEAINAVSNAEMNGVKPMSEPPVPTQEDVSNDARFSIALVARRGETLGDAGGRVVTVEATGAAYGIDSATGDVRWRRFVGFGGNGFVIDLQDSGQDAVVLLDHRRQELVCLQATTGQLQWRLPCPGSIAAPQFTAGRIYVSGTDDNGQGYVLAVEPASGQVVTAVSLPVPVSVGAVADVESQRLIQPADHSSLYLLKLDDLSCEGVTYLGHESGTIVVPPAIAAGLLLLAENPGIDFSQLYLFRYDPEQPGKLKPSLDQPLRYEGQTVFPMSTYGRRVLTVTDRGGIRMLEVDPDQPVPVRVLAEATSTVTPGTMSFPLFDKGRLWVGDNQLTQFELQTSRGQLVRKWLNSKGDRFAGPLRLINDVLIHVRRPAQKAGFAIAAVSVDGGQRNSETIWEVDLGVPVAGVPFVDRTAQEINVVTSNGALFSVGRDAIRSGLQSSAKQSVMSPQLPRLVDSLALSETRRVFVAEAGDRVVVHDATNADAPLRTQRLDLGGQQVTAGPAAMNDMLLVPTDGGAVSLINAADGSAAVTPYQSPAVNRGKTEWFRPAVISSDQAVVADQRGNLLQLAIQPNPQPHLAAVAQQANVGLIADPVVLNDGVWGVVKAADQDLLRQFGINDLQQKNQVELGGRLLWGPAVVGDVVLVQNDQYALVAVDSSGGKRFQTEPLEAALVGQPVAYETGFVIANVEGSVDHRAASDGTSITSVSVGETLGGGLGQFSGNRFIVTGGDGTLHVVVLE